MNIVKFIGFYPPVGYDHRDKMNTMPWDMGKVSFVRRPYPIANTATMDQTDIITKLQNIQQVHAKKIDYSGGSDCRICEEMNGGSEYAIDGFVWPSGYIHYLRDHNVKIDEEFKKFILDFNPEESHDTTFKYEYAS